MLENQNESANRPNLLEQIKGVMRVKHYSIRTEEAYVGWVKKFVLFYNKKHPKYMGAKEIENFLTHLAVVGKAAASTQNQALNALVFLYREVLGQEVGKLNIEWSERPVRLPVVLTKEEVKRVFDCLEGTRWIMAAMLYGSGLRLMECLRLRVKDLDFEYGQVVVRDGKGNKDRLTMLASSVKEPLKGHLEKVKILHDNDLGTGFGSVYLPYALERKYPNAQKEFAWQYVFPASKLSDVSTTMIYTHVLNKGVRAVRSPLDRM